jgi:hypothetical protein
MRWRALGLAVVMLFLISGTAEALTITGFTAHATSARVRYAIHYCDGRGRVHEHLDFFALDRPSGDFSGDAFYRLGVSGCYVTRGHFFNRYLGGLWVLRLSMSDSLGALRQRSRRVFLP